MNYEKKYKEALEKAKDFYKGYKQRDNQLYANDLETIFPELRESEDEQIRKEFCKDIWTFIPNEKAHKYISWLAKQGETFTKKDVDDAYLKGISDTKNELEKQGGQKPAKWSLEDERVIAIINNALTESNTPPDDYDKVYDWLESLRQRI